MCRLEEGEDLLVLVSGEVSPDAHVHHHDLPLGVAVRTWGADIVAVPAVARPEVCPAQRGR